MANPVTDLIEKLKAKQGDMTDVAFAEKLGMSRPMWALVKTGQRDPGLDFLKAIMKAFPDLTVEVMAFLKEDGKKEAPDVTK